MRSLFLQRSFHHYAVISCVVFLFYIGPVMAQEQVEGSITVEEAVQVALERNLELKVQEQELGIAQGALVNARLFPNPELELQGESDTVFSNEGESRFSVGLGQTFLIGPKRRSRIEIAELTMNKTRRDIENSRRLLRAQVKDAFYALLLLQERGKQADELIEINKRLVELTEGRFREGFGSALDVNLAQIQLQQVQSNRAQIEKELSVAKTTLNLFLGRPATAPLITAGEFTDRPVQVDPAQLEQMAVTQRADLNSQRVAVEIAGKQIDLAKAERIPDVTVSLDYSQDRSVFPGLNFTDHSRLAGLKLSVPIPLFNRNQGEIIQAKSRQTQATLERGLLHAVIEKELSDAATRLEVARQMVARIRDGILPLAGDHFRLAETAYARGQASILDVMEAQRRFSEARLGSLEAQYEYNVALVELERVIGMDPTRPEASGSHEGGMK